MALGMMCASMPSGAQAEKPVLSAQESDPVRMGWMQGFPPLKDRQLRFADGSFFEFPAMRWSVVHMSEFMPVVSVSRGLRAPDPLPYRLDPRIDVIAFRPTNADTDMTWEESLWQNYTDGIVIRIRVASSMKGTSARWRRTVGTPRCR